MYFILLVTVACSPLTFAFWPFNDYLPPVQRDVQKSCIQWLNFYGFDDENFHNMVATALARNFGRDKDVHWIAAVYACRLTIGENIINTNIRAEIPPTNFCRSMVGLQETYRFVALKNFTNNSCEAFIYMYGYGDGNSTDDISINRWIAKTIGLDMIPFQSMWGSFYGNYLLSNPDTYLTPSLFCKRLGKLSPAYPMKMVALNEVENYDCAEMIKYFDFTSNQNYNLEKVRHHPYQNDVLPYIPRVVKIFINSLHRIGIFSAYNTLLTIEEVCQVIRHLNL